MRYQVNSTDGVRNGKRTLWRTGQTHAIIRGMKNGGMMVTAIALSSCVAGGSGEPPLVANVRSEGQECRVTVDGQRLTQKQLLELARRSPGRHGIIVYAQNDTIYKCIGAAILTLQEAGLQSVDVAAWTGS